MPHPDTDRVLVVIAIGNPAYRAYCLESVARRHPVALIDAAAPTWQLEHLRDHEVADPHDLDALRAAVARLAARHEIAGVLTWDEYCLVPAATVAADLHLPGPGAATAAACRDKSAARAVWAADGVPSALSIHTASLTEATAAARRIGFPVVLKPTSHAGSIGVVKAETAEELAAAFAYADQAAQDGGVLVEEYLPGPEISVECVTVHGITTPVAVTHKQLGPEPRFDEIGHTVTAEDPLLDRVGPVAAAALAALGVTRGISHVEMRLTPTGPRLIEANGRLGGDLIGHLVNLATGIDLPAVAADLALGRPVDLTPTRRATAGVRFISPHSSGTVHHAQARPELGTPAWLERLRWERGPGQQILLPADGGTLHTSRLAHLVATGTTTAEVDERLNHAAALLDIRLSPTG
ncbi:ATP-grasp domain-containing protein [Kitasatospora sp. NA04385]|uniref:ATP-grasp domain-containing protein n=1 Tax=Kitasatospora sp. NA04385 TaxID=2742135 RepID=UPI001591585C|nr:ATP-grasp domain-containing protein [Kitasatospora sp. NA04385]QKW20597.1 ATP-grasp domain-containing protein [Kitasatospora sp. NA04385]